MWNPYYFNGSDAVHGLDSVPNYPASHGCARIPMHIADYFYTLVHQGESVFVVGTPKKAGNGYVGPVKTPPTAATTTTTVKKPTTPTTKPHDDADHGQEADDHDDEAARRRRPPRRRRNPRTGARRAWSRRAAVVVSLGGYELKAARPMIGAGGGSPARLPRNGLFEKSKIPPSDAAIR